MLSQKFLIDGSQAVEKRHGICVAAQSNTKAEFYDFTVTLSLNMTDATNRKDIQALIDVSTNQWRGCDWDTSFGKSRLNLRGMRPHQTRMLAEATSGDESKDWDAATYWLLKVEQDAKDANNLAILSVSLFQSGKFLEAASGIERALQLESRYREPIAWVDLHELLAAASQVH
jgi:hypothetical protein